MGFESVKVGFESVKVGFESVKVGFESVKVKVFIGFGFIKIFNFYYYLPVSN